MFNHLSSPLGTICVLDIETILDPVTASILPTRPHDLPKALLKVTAASLLWACEDRGGWSVSKIETKLALDAFSDDAEEAILEMIDQAISILVENDGLIVTFNGVAHDLPIIQRRAARALRFDLAHLHTSRPRHVDLMLGMTRPDRSHWPSLTHSVAGLGLPFGGHFFESELVPYEAQKCEADVASTFLLMLTELSMRSASEQPLLLGWAALADRIELMGARGQHLGHYADHDVVALARRYRDQPR